MRARQRSEQFSRLTFPLCVLGLFSSGCMGPGPIFPAMDPPIVWPQSGDTPRYAYVGTISGEADLKRRRSFWEWLADFGGGRKEPARIAIAAGVARSSGGQLYVSDSEAGVVHRFDLATREYRALRDAGNGREFTTPMGLATAGNEVVVADRSRKTLTVLSPSGEPASVIGEGLLDAPVGICVGPRSGRIYVVDVIWHAVKVFNRDGKLLFSFGQRGDGDGEFNFPTHIACDTTETLYVSDTLNSRVQVFDRNGRFLRTWGKRGDAPGTFSQPKGIACDREGHVYVVDSHFENVQVFTSEGELLLTFGSEGRGPGQFWLPIGIFIDRDDTIWVGDSFNHRAQVFRYLAEDDSTNSP